MKTLAILLALSALAFSQVPVSPAPPLHYQFLDANGAPLANGKIFTYAAGTSNLQNTYADALGISQNPNPIILDASGAVANGSHTTAIFLANLSYKFVAYNSSNVFQWSVDNVSGYFSLLNQINTWTGNQTFTGTITDLLTDNQLIFGPAGNTTIFDVPPPLSNITIHFPITTDTLVGRATTDTLTNKTLTNPLFNSGACGIYNSPGTYICIPNANPTGTTLGSLVKFINAPSQATIESTSSADATSISAQGICVAGCGNTGTATIQQSGLVNCNFDGATVAGDLVIVSPSVTGDCRDSSFSSYASIGYPYLQVLGVVLSTNGSSGYYSMMLGPYLNPTQLFSGFTPNIVAGTGAGTGPTITPTGTDYTGAVQVLTGSAPASTATVFTSTFGRRFPTFGTCVVSPANAATAAIMVSSSVVPTTTATNWTLSVGTGLAGTTTYKWNFVCTGY